MVAEIKTLYGDAVKKRYCKLCHKQMKLNSTLSDSYSLPTELEYQVDIILWCPHCKDYYLWTNKSNDICVEWIGLNNTDAPNDVIWLISHTIGVKSAHIRRKDRPTMTIGPLDILTRQTAKKWHQRLKTCLVMS